jgi:hypothetical protein
VVGAIWTRLLWDGKVSLIQSWRDGAKQFNLKLPDVIPGQVGILVLLLGQGMLNIDYA